MQKWLWLLLILAPAVSARDIYIGTLEYEGERLLLKRCDLAQNTYLLWDSTEADAEGTPVASFLADPAHREGQWSVEVIGEYEARDGRDGLAVLSFENLRVGHSCHLLDAVDALLESQPPRDGE